MPSRSERSSQRRRLVAATRAGERPAERVVAVDRGTIRACPAGQAHRGLRRDPMVGAIHGRLEVDAETVRLEQAVDRRHDRSLPPCLRPSPLPLQQVAVERHELRQRHRGRGSRGGRDGGAELPASRLDPGALLEREDVAREDRERRTDVPGGTIDASRAELELRELDVRPRGRLGDAAGRVERERHRGDRAEAVAGELTRVGDAGVRGEGRLDGDHPVEGREGLVVAAELEERVADDAVRSARVRGEPAGLPTEVERSPEVVADQGEVAEAQGDGRVVGPGREGAAQGALRERQEGRVAGLAPAELVRETERPETVGIAGAGAELRLELRDRRRRAAPAAEPRECSLEVDPGRGLGGRTGRSGLGEDAAEQAAQRKYRRHCATPEQRRCPSSHEPLPSYR